MPPRHLALPALALALLSPGCCFLARLFCGPDDSEWVQISYRTPQETVATFKEAVRRDSCQVIYDCFGEGFKERHGIGLMEACVAWEKLKDEVFGLHMLGYAEVTELASSDARATFELRVSGYRFRIDLVRQQLWEVHTDLEHAPTISDFAPPPWRVRYGQLDREGRMAFRGFDDGPVVLVLILPDPESVVHFPVDTRSMRAFSLGPVWKVEDFRAIEDPQ